MKADRPEAPRSTPRTPESGGVPTRDRAAAFLMLVAVGVLVYTLRDGAPGSVWAWVGAVFFSVLLVDEAVGILRRRAARHRRTTRERGA